MGVLPWEERVPLPSVSLSRAQGGQTAVAVATLLEVERERGWVNLPAGAGKAFILFYYLFIYFFNIFIGV